MFSLVERHGGEVLLVHLTCRPEILEGRIPSAGRANKMHSLEVARDEMAGKDYFTPIPERHSLQIDNSELAPDIVAREIAAHFALPRAERET